jgi:excisionase family DNA binding protein
MEATNQLKLYSISAAAKSLSLGKDAVYKLVADGKIGYVEIGKRKKIPYSELVRFQTENVIRQPEVKKEPVMSKREIEKFFNLNNTRKPELNGKEILELIIG